MTKKYSAAGGNPTNPKNPIPVHTEPIATAHTDAPLIVLVQPWIHDFAAYDVWAHPLGLLLLAGILRRHGYRVRFIDCLDRFHPEEAPTDPKARCGRGPYRKAPLPRPRGLEDVPRRFCRYGIRPNWLQAELKATPVPDLVLVTSMMTYWWTGVAETIAAVRRVWPEVPVVLGGVYATLCREHAEANCGADRVVPGQGERKVLEAAAEMTGFSSPPRFDFEDLDALPYPALDLKRTLASVPLLTSQGCPFRCAYCASRLLQPKRRLRSPASVVEEVRYWHRDRKVEDFALYDDAFLVNAEDHALPLLERLAAERLPVRFHTPNALHIQKMDRQTARLLHRAGFHTIRLGLETDRSSSRRDLDEKVSEGQFESAVRHLKAAGFDGNQIGVYLLAGLPDQQEREIVDAIQRVRDCGVSPILAHYSPVPGTTLWPKAVASSRYDLGADPVFTNNAVWPCRKEPFSWSLWSRLKALAAKR